MNINHDLGSTFTQLALIIATYQETFYPGYKTSMELVALTNENNSFNGTEMENATAQPNRGCPRATDEVKMISLCLKAILIVPTIFGNTLVFKAFYKFPSLRTASNIILLSLSVADSLTVLPFVLHISFIALRLQKSGPSTSIQWLCNSSAWLSLVLASVIILHLALISVERVIAVKYSLRYPTIVTNSRVLIASITVWLWAVGATVVFPQALRADSSGNTYETLYKAFHPCIRHQRPSCHRHDQRRPSSPSSARDFYQIFMVISLLAIPILIILSSYGYVFVVARKHRKQIREQHDTQGVSTWRRELKGAYTLGIVVGVCLSSFVPLLVVTSCRVFGSRDFVHSLSSYASLKFIVYDVALGLNACLNPLIYAWRHEKFKNAFRQLLRCA